MLPLFQTRLAESTDRLLTTVAALTDDDLRAPSRLPGWTRGHVVSHLARNADSLVNLLNWARTGIPTPQYASPEDRVAGIEAGAPRPAKEQLLDLEDSAARFAALAAELTESDWTVRVSGANPPDHPAWYVLRRRQREVEIHHGDLGCGYDWPDWPEDFVLWDFYDTMRSWRPGSAVLGEIVVHTGEDRIAGETWSGLGEGPTVEGTRRDLFAWLTGRAGGDRLSADGPLPTLPPWPYGSAPAGLPSRIPEEWPPAI